ncbi:hypothetical protein DF22_003223 [Xylella fastidiosa]|nr:hypothetical protein DF22_003223 [Xylella fastidiosa]
MTVHGIGGSLERFDLAGHVLVTFVFDGQDITWGALGFLRPELLNMRVLAMM